MSTVTPSEPTVNYPQSRYAIAYDPRTHLFACSYGGEVFDRAMSYGDGDALCALHWCAQDAPPPLLSFEDACYLALLEDDAALAPLPSGDGRWTLGRVR